MFVLIVDFLIHLLILVWLLIHHLLILFWLLIHFHINAQFSLKRMWMVKARLMSYYWAGPLARIFEINFTVTTVWNTRETGDIHRYVFQLENNFYYFKRHQDSKSGPSDPEAYDIPICHRASLWNWNMKILENLWSNCGILSQKIDFSKNSIISHIKNIEVKK